MSRESEKCMYCDRARKNLNKTNWNRHKAACEIATTTIVSKKAKVSITNKYKVNDIKSFFLNKTPRGETSITVPAGSTTATDGFSK